MGIRTTRRGRFLAGLALCATLLAGGQAWATEGSGGAYPNGAEDFMSGAVPPPGTYFIDYFDYYSAGSLKNNSGNNALPQFDLNVYANTFRFLHVTDKKFLGANWGAHIFIPVVYQDASLTTPLASRSGDNFNLGDIIVDPFILAWHSKNWHAVTGVDIYCPTGSYDSARLVNLSRNYWTFEPIVAGTFVSDSGFEVSAKFMYDFNTINTDTDYTSGQEFHFDYLVGQKIKNVSLGAGGYYYQQITNDQKAGATVVDNKGRTVAIGPALKYDYKNMSFIVKYYFEMDTKNRPEGNNLWAKFVYAF